MIIQAVTFQATTAISAIKLVIMYALSNYSNRETIAEFMKKLLKTEKTRKRRQIVSMMKWQMKCMIIPQFM